jgi:lantibiotic biosynthesis dehydratase-like protein
MGVVNATFPGFGKMISRFLHLFDPAVTHELRRWNAAVSPGSLLLEDTDASYFNANLHPPLMPYEIWMPGGHNSLPATQHIAVTELAVTLDEAHDTLQLLHQPSGKPAYVFDLGFQAHGGRSPLFRLLDRFSLAAYCSHYPLVSALNTHWQPQPAGAEAREVPWTTPRIVYDDRLVLQRQAWHFPKALLPMRQPQESDWAYFARVNTWRLEHQLPDEVFISLFDRRTTPDMPAPGQQLHSRDDYKPQYICFHNPFLVTLFAKLLHKVPHSLKVEEMLPNSEQLLTLGTQQHVTEWVVQWYTTGEEAA